MVEGGAGEELGTVRLEQRWTWRLGHGAGAEVKHEGTRARDGVARRCWCGSRAVQLVHEACGALAAARAEASTAAFGFGAQAYGDDGG